MKQYFDQIQWSKYDILALPNLFQNFVLIRQCGIIGTSSFPLSGQCLKILVLSHQFPPNIHFQYWIYFPSLWRRNSIHHFHRTMPYLYVKYEVYSSNIHALDICIVKLIMSLNLYLAVCMCK